MGENTRHILLNFRVGILAFIAMMLMLAMSISAAGQDISVRAAVEKQEVMVGEPFLLQIQVTGDGSPSVPDLSGLSGFTVQDRGGQQNNSESITIINGRMERVSQRGYIFNYSLTPQQTGSLIVPAITVVVDNKTYQTVPVRISVSEPKETDDFKLRLEISQKEMYVGEPVVLTATWYVGKDVESFEFSYPLPDDPRFTVAMLDDPALNQQNAIKIALGKKTIIARKGQGVLDGKQYLTVSFKQILIPRQAGAVKLPPATVSAQALVGYRQQRNRDPMADFFERDIFGRGNRAVYETVITPSNELTIQVTALPTAGKPANFSGLVGQYSIAAEATPAEVSVGDPITLKVMVTGPEYLDNVELPLLQEQELLARDFKIPEEMAAGEVQGRVKVFTQTIRAKHSEVRAVPPITFSYFNPATGKYETVRSGPVPLNVQTARVVTAQDAEGQQVVKPKKELTVFEKGIAYNYEDPQVLQNEDRMTRWLTSPRMLLFLVLPPLVYLLLLGGVAVVRRQRLDPEGQQARKAYGELDKSLKAIDRQATENDGSGYVRLSEALRAYLGKKLRLAAGALTYHDVQGLLTKRGVDSRVLSGLKAILDQCEAHRFAGPAGGGSDLKNLAAKASEVAAALERSLS